MKTSQISLLGNNAPKLNDFKEVRLRGVSQYGSRELSTDNIIEFIRKNLANYQPNTLKSIFSSLISYAKFQKIAIERELIIRLIPKVQGKIFDTINKEELEQLKNSSPKNRKINDRNNLVLDFLFYAGLRVNELINIRHCDYQNNQLRILGKGNKVRYVFLPDFLAQHFQFNSQEYFFQTKNKKRLIHSQIRKIINRGIKKAGVNKHITPHSFRRSFATLLNNREVKLTTIQKLLGHSDINTTTTYIHNNYQELYQDYSKL
ncbi:20465_t:CDS:2 [Funneliformis geosporum]|uniref:16502_t:CDS:1 n=1 Tax=Funneliformis geosporum TaxID=1117311 RepID=A0A9W4SYL5_9GLOM|nr:20465_t:CDS:2 [Funneliformis geosporum]CAI2183837.1 16502_t:CDS:2 [Funneliformis geosporum]